MRVVVIGSGLLGLSTAWFLVRRGMDVRVVDRADGPARGTSFANAGLLSPSMPDPWNAPGVLGELWRSLGRSDAPLLMRARAVPSLLGWGLQFLRESRPQRHDLNTLKNVRLALYSQIALKELQQQIDFPFDYLETGSLRVFRDPSVLEQATRRMRWLEQHGISFKVLDSAETVSLEPALADIRARIVGSIYSSNDSAGDARRFCEGVAARLRQAGAKLSYGTSVVGWKREDRRIVAAITSSDSLVADAFVLAGASSSRDLTRRLGFDLPVRPVKGYSITIPMDVFPSTPHVPVIDDVLHAAVVPIGRCLRVAGTAEITGPDLSIPPARIDNLRHLLRQIYPCADERGNISTLRPWAGLRPVTSDGVPILGRTPLENLYINTGHGHLGWTMAAGSGKAVADLIAGKRPVVELSDYALARFTPRLTG